jgi:hypothetical protein
MFEYPEFCCVCHCKCDITVYYHNHRAYCGDCILEVCESEQAEQNKEAQE